VDVGKLREREKLEPRSDSLAAKVETENALARSYIDYLLGRVICCAHAEQLRNYKTAITVEGMLYQGYVARPLRRELMEDVFIGRRAVELRIQRLESELKQTEAMIQQLAPVLQVLSRQSEPLFTQYFVQSTVQENLQDYLRGLEITTEVAKIDEQLSQLDLLWLNEQRRTIERLDQEIKDLRNQKDQKSISLGQMKEQIRQLEYERLPEQYQQLSSLEDRLQEDFSQEYLEQTGLPRYQQELARLKRPATVYKNFSDQLIRTSNEQEQLQKRLFQTRLDYADRFKPCSFRVDAPDNTEYEAEQCVLEESELPQYREKIKAARESAMEQFQNDFLAKLKSSIDQVREQVRSLNKALKQAQFGTDQYQFRVDRNPDYANYYDMIMAPELMEGEGGLFALPFQQKYGKLMDLANWFGHIYVKDKRTVIFCASVKHAQEIAGQHQGAEGRRAGPL
jgi:hypothetical protein